MLLEDIILIILSLVAMGIIVPPAIKLYKIVGSPKRDPLLEAKIRFEEAKKEEEAAKINKQTDDIYEHLYEETLEDSRKQNKG
jgi:hypothetical protein